MSRISLQQGFNQGLRGILNVQSQLFKTQNQIATGRRVLQPSDDPVAAARILQLEQELSRLDQFKKNIDGVEASLMLQDTQMESVTTLLVRVRELTLSAGNASLSASERRGIATELANRLEELANLANTRSVTGEYIFGGYQGEQPPFAQQAGQWVYRGDEGQRLVQVASSTQIAAGDNGKDIFVNIPDPRPRISADGSNLGDATISGARIIDQGQYAADFTTPPYAIVFDDPPDTFSIVDGNGDPVVGASNLPYTSGELISFNGMEVRITGTPEESDRFEIQSPGTRDMLNGIAALVDGLRNLGDGAEDKLRLGDLLAGTLDWLDGAEANISSNRATLGARLNTLESTRNLHSGSELVNQQVLTDIRDLDYAEAISRLTLEDFILQAAQQSFARISNLSLFNFLR